MSIKVMKMALEALENASPSAWASRVDSDTMKSIWRKHAEALEGLQVLLAELDNASCKSAQKRLEAQQPATATACGIPGMTKTTCPYCEQGFAFEHEQPATGEPVGYMNEGHIHELAMRRLPYGYVYPEAGAGASTAVYTHPAPSVPATPEPVLFIHPDTFAMNNAHVGAWKPGHELTSYIPLYTHPVPSMPATPEPVGVNQLRKELSDANDFIQSLADLCVKYETLLGYRKTKAPEGASELAEARGESNVNTELDLAMPDSICDHVFVLDPKSSIRICNKCGTVECKKHTRPAPSVPEGYVLVPIEPTQAMMNVQTWDFSSFCSPREIWAAMLAAK